MRLPGKFSPELCTHKRLGVKIAVACQYFNLSYGEKESE